ncbi:hypothetical protein K432DRAFT_377748 [Lepidopterella palustris CBS 459.81]|uniref:Proteasome assembly chaperone 3 n=1 Tax=Lepidopterella palustris CBS 459.81 TaxID=1314670 RepID=A0A8E2JK03_9PEZI|nr:hypothetical protein K432DRAFT_377748 [Lepidopterella palustris CBS 459.81]
MTESERYEVTPSPFPARTRTASGTINGVETTATAMYFADKIMVTITQSGRLAHWIHVPLDTESPAAEAAVNRSGTIIYDDEDIPSSDLLPMSHLTATTILGGTMPEMDTLGQLCATQIASAIVTKDPRERRMVVVGLGLDKSVIDVRMGGREGYTEVVGLVLGVL